MRRPSISWPCSTLIQVAPVPDGTTAPRARRARERQQPLAGVVAATIDTSIGYEVCPDHGIDGGVLLYRADASALEDVVVDHDGKDHYSASGNTDFV